MSLLDPNTDAAVLEIKQVLKNVWFIDNRNIRPLWPWWLNDAVDKRLQMQKQALLVETIEVLY